MPQDLKGKYFKDQDYLSFYQHPIAIATIGFTYYPKLQSSLYEVSSALVISKVDESTESVSQLVNSVGG